MADIVSVAVDDGVEGRPERDAGTPPATSYLRIVIIGVDGSGDFRVGSRGLFVSAFFIGPHHQDPDHRSGGSGSRSTSSLTAFSPTARARID